MQSGGRVRGAVRGVPGGRGHPDLARRPVDRAARPRRPRPPPRAGRASAGPPISSPVPASRRTTSTSSSAAPARPTTTGPARSTTCSASTSPPPHVGAYALTVEPGTPLAADVAPPPRRRRPGRPLRAGRRRPHRRRVPLGGGLELGAPRPRVPAQPALLGPGRLPRHRFAPPTRTSRPPVVERADARPVRRGGRARPLGRRRRGGARRPSSGRSKSSSLSLRTARRRAGRRARRRRRAGGGGAGRQRRRTGRSSPSGAACSPTR